MNASLLRRLAPGAAALALGLTSASVLAQDGPPPGPPVTRPNTNQNTPANNRDVPARSQTPTTTKDVLPGVPATARDPAPPGTRGVRVDVPPGAAAGTSANPAAAPAASGRTTRRPAGQGRIHIAEGVVTRIDRAGKQVNGELQRFAFDPNQDWYSYVTRGAQGVVDNQEEQPADSGQKRQEENAEAQAEANDPADRAGAERPGVMEMAITKRTHTYTHARTEDGVDIYTGPTMASPDTTSSRTGLTRRTPTQVPSGRSGSPVAAAPNEATAATTSTAPNVPVAGSGSGLGGAPTNFTNLREGSYVAVRYRKVGDVNEVLNLTLIDLPLNPTGGEGSPNGGAGGAAGTTGAAGTRTGTEGPNVPAVPRVPVGASLPR